MSVAFIFPGQGSQYPRMGKVLAENFEVARKIFEEADEVLGFKLSRLCFEAQEELLKQTEITQLAVMTCSLSTLQVIKERGISASMVAGHSLGEYSALVCAGSLGFAEALKLVRIRAQAMNQASKIHPGIMAAIIGLKFEEVKKSCEEASEYGVVCPANYNSPEQIVISGETAAVRRAIELAKEKGAKRCLPLAVSGPFHSPLMKSAAQRLKAALKEVEAEPPKIPFVANATATFQKDPSRIKELLVSQITNPVLWSDSVKRMAANGASKFLEVGPGRVLSGLVSRTQSEVETFTTNSEEEIKKIVI